MLLIAYGVSNIVALFFPLDLSSGAAVPMHIVATIMRLVLMLAPMGFAAAAFHGWLHVHSIASLITSIVAGVVAHGRTIRTDADAGASASASASVPSCSGWRFSPLRCGAHRRRGRSHNAHKGDGRWELKRLEWGQTGSGQ